MHSGDPDPDRFDEWLSASLLAVMQATDRVMPPAADPKNPITPFRR